MIDAFLNEEPPKDNRDAYERVRAWLSRPNAERSFMGTRCVYHDRLNETKCAIGGILPPNLLMIAEEADLTTNGVSVASLIETSRGIKEFFSNCDVDFLVRLQELHDTEENWDGFGFIKEAFIEFREKNFPDED